MKTKFTLQELDWRSWLPPLDIKQANQKQLTVLAQSHPKALTSDYYRLLVLSPDILAQRSIAYNEIMYGLGGASREERELAALTTSRENGCAYCASVHANRFKQEANRQDVAEQLLFDATPDEAGETGRDNSIIKFSLKLTRTPELIDQEDIKHLAQQGLTLEEISDIIHSSAIFGWANRLMLSLGQSQQVCLFSD